MANILVTGGTGLIGSAMLSILSSEGYRCWILTRSPEKYQAAFSSQFRFVKSLDEIPLDTFFIGIINLAGAPIGDSRWTEKRKEILFKSRVSLTNNLIGFISRLELKPEFLISGSAIGYYGARTADDDQQALDENAEPIKDFTHSLCQQWEQAAKKAEDYGVRVCILRTGVVLARNGGMLGKLFPTFIMSLGGKIGSGKQTISWIHINDLLDAIKYLISNNKQSGAFNLTSPEPVTNLKFVKSFAKALRRLAIIPLPAWFIKLLFGKMGEAILLKGQKVIPARLTESGFKFRHASLDEALTSIYEDD